MRRGIGIGAVRKHQIAQERYEEKGNEIQEAQFEQIRQQFDLFRKNLEDFASKYRHDIRKNSQLRKMFQEMCSSIGVDPLTSAKDFWSVLGVFVVSETYPLANQKIFKDLEKTIFKIRL